MNELEMGKKKRMAVAYLLINRGEIPDGLGKFFDKLSSYEVSMKDLMGKIQENEKALNGLLQIREQMFGAISSIVDMVVDELPNDKCLEWSEKYSLIINDNANKPPVPKQDKSIDIAGSTSRQKVINENPTL